MPKILDIITVTKDDPGGVAATIRSTRTLRDRHEVRQIIVDSSNEAIRDKLSEMVKVEKHVEYIWQEPSGIARAFNLGLSLSEAEWVWFLNGGDEVHPDADAGNLLYLLRKSRADALIFELENKQSGTRPKHPPLWAIWPPVLGWIPHPATIIRSNVFNRYGFFNTEYKIAMDYEAWLRFFSKEVVVDMISLPIALFDEEGISTSQTRETAKEGGKAIRAHLRILLKLWAVSGKTILAALKYFMQHKGEQK